MDFLCGNKLCFEVSAELLFVFVCCSQVLRLQMTERYLRHMLNLVRCSGLTNIYVVRFSFFFHIRL